MFLLSSIRHLDRICAENYAKAVTKSQQWFETSVFVKFYILSV